ncbi:uncharacterized protein LOC127080630 [Lathyrus oleraceus]|uniref:uncharacterized protein LOC127080630 n=1 Tax=Pisum sativum TaxID=3888 RepID=UPI0021D1C372|nr:uncharacterized protein LOC127080630 [Pisum sativum]
MEDGETITDMQNRFSHLINQLNALGRTTPNDVATNKILRYLNRNWLPKVTAIKEANDLRTSDMATLFGKLQEHEQELMSLDKNKKSLKKEKKEKKEKVKDTERKFIALKTSRYNSSTNDACESGSSDDGKDLNADMRLFVRRKVGHYKTDCPLLKKYKGKDKHHNKYSKVRRAYIAWESDSESSSNDKSSDEEENTNLCLTVHRKKKKNVSHSKYDHVDKMYYCDLKNAFSTLHNEAKEAFKRLASNNKIFCNLEKKISDSEKELETLKKSMIEVTKGKTEDDKGFWFGWSRCETCHIWQREVRTLRAKLDKALQPKVAFAIDISHFRSDMNNPYQKYTYVVECLEDTERTWILDSGC